MATKKKQVVTKLKIHSPKQNSVRYEQHEDKKLKGIYVPRDLLAELTDERDPESVTVTISVP